MLFVSEFLPKWNSGAEGSLLSIGEALERRGHKVDYLWKDTASGFMPHPRLYDFFELPARQLARVRRALRHAYYDVAILSQPYSYLVYERLASIYPRTLFLNRTHGWEDRMAETNRLVGWRELGGLQRRFVDISSGFMAKACERTARASHGIIAPSELCADFIRNRYAARKAPVRAIPYGIEKHLIRDRREAAPDEGQRLLFVGQYLPRKGSRVLEEALPALAARFPGASMTFVVPKHSVPKVTAAFEPSFGNRLRVLPWMSRQALADVYACNDILLFPSFFEGFGKVFLEAMAAGLCVVGFREGGLPDIATHSRSALTCATGDRHAFRMLAECALSNPFMAREIGLRARDAARRFTWEHHALETENFCRELKFGPVNPSAVELAGAA